MTHHIGIDVHDDFSTLQHMDNEGCLGLSITIPTEKEEFARILDSLDVPVTITFEAGRNYFWLHDFFSKHPKVSLVNVVDARRSRKIAEELATQAGYGRAKNDRIDAEMCGHETRRGLAPCIHVPTADQLEKRTFNRHRMDLTKQRTRIVNKMHGLLRLRGIRIKTVELTDNLDSQKEVLASLTKFDSIVLNHHLVLIKQIEDQIIECDHFLDLLLPLSDPQLQLIITAPGFGSVLSRTVHTEILDIAYFNAPKSLINYAGLAPVENESNHKKGDVHLNRYTNHYLKYAFVEAAHHASTHPKYRRKYQLDVKKHGKTRAKLNLARRLAKAVYWMLVRQQPFKH
jgi:transposase